MEEEYEFEGGDEFFMEADEPADSPIDASDLAATTSPTLVSSSGAAASGDAPLSSSAASSGRRAAAASALKTLYAKPHKVLNASSMALDMARVVGETMALLCVTEDEAAVLLKQGRWNSDAVSEAFFDDEPAFRARCGVTAGGDPPPAPPLGTTVYCGVTMEEVPVEDADACACGHWFSAAAWQGHVTAAMAEPRAALLLTCMEDGCKEAVRPRLFRKFLPAAAFARYKEYQSRSFAEENRLYVWCPSPGCEFVIVREGGTHADVACPAGHAFCTKCLSKPHRPASCDQSAMWVKREGDDGQNASWLLANTKPCPTCRKAIEKNQGCNHMRCSLEAGGCGTDFCWICLQPWSKHARDFYNCNNPPPKTLYDASSVDKARAELAQYAYYYGRYAAQRQAQAHASVKLRAAVREKQQELANFLGSDSASALEFMENAVDIIMRGREVAANTYVHAYYIKDPSYSALFSDSQLQLERNLEHLHEHMEMHTVSSLLGIEDGADSDAAADRAGWAGNFAAWRMKVVNLMTCTHKFMLEIIAAVEDGFVSGACFQPSETGSASNPIDVRSPLRRGREDDVDDTMTGSAAVKRSRGAAASDEAPRSIAAGMSS